jgi:hypothetical protein
MASIASKHTVRTVAGHLRHVLSPSRRKANVGTAEDVVVLLLGAPFLAHVLLDVAIHLAFVVVGRRQARRPKVLSAAVATVTPYDGSP